MVAESVADVPSPTRRSMPPSSAPDDLRSAAREARASVNGNSSMRRGGDRRRSNSSSPNSETSPCVPRGDAFQKSTSPVARMSRLICSPQMERSSSGTENRICENGILNSAFQPSLVMDVPTCHTAS